MEIGKAIKAARKAKGYTLQKLADKSGVTYTTLAYWERGRTSPNVVPLIAVADVLNITLDKLVGRNNVDDVVIKVRCKDCKHFGREISRGRHNCNAYEMPYCLENDYCSYGERADNEHDGH